jgi:hypothetical protein
VVEFGDEDVLTAPVHPSLLMQNSFFEFCRVVAKTSEPKASDNWIPQMDIVDAPAFQRIEWVEAGS